MLATRPSKRDKSDFFDDKLRFDILGGDTPIGKLVYDRKRLRGEITLGEGAFTVEHTGGGDYERLYQRVARVATAGAPPPPDRYELKDAASRTLALAEQDKQGFAVDRGGERITFRKGPSRPFHLRRAGADQPLGWVGQKKFLTTMLHMDLPDGFAAAFQIFLLVLVLNVTMRRAESMTT